MKRSLIGFCLLMVLYDPGLCQTAKAKPAFYIVLNSLTKACTIVDRMPQADLLEVHGSARQPVRGRRT